MLVDDSPTQRLFLTDLIQSCPELMVCAAFNSGEEALLQIEKINPQVISMDLHLPGINGLETTRRIMETWPTPIVVVTSEQDLELSFQALRAGALTVVPKPQGPGHAGHQQQVMQLCTQLRIMSEIRVVRQRPRAPLILKSSVEGIKVINTSPYEILGVAASTGGPKALVTLFNALGPDFPLAALVVQHMTDSFFDSFVSWLDTMIPQAVYKAEHGASIQPGSVYLAPPHQHMRYFEGRIQLAAGPAVSFQCPSATVLLESLALGAARRSIGVVLTGMGNDGAQGLLALSKAGGYTCAEAESSAIVYGMPGVAAQLGAARYLLPLAEIGPHLLRVLSQEVKP